MLRLYIHLTLLFIISVPMTTSAQEATIKGHIRTEDDHTFMPNVSVILDDTLHKSTDFNGYFQFSGVAAGEHKLQTTFLGFEKEEFLFRIIPGQDLVEFPDIQLGASAIQIREIVVSSYPTNYSNKYEGSSTVVSPGEIEFINPIGTEEVLKKVSGVNVSGDMGISNRLNVGIRGSYPRRSGNIILMEDGTPIAPAPYLAPEAYYNPPSDRLDAVEIIKGADILTFGSNTMYGAINYITKKPPLVPALGIQLTGGEKGYRSGYITYGGTWDKIGVELQVLNKHFGGFQDNSQSSIFNTTAKLYTELNTRSSLYVKLNYHQELSKATYSALTALTYQLDPLQNPFDADDLTTKRYGVDMIYHYKLNKKIILSSKIYASQFQRDWWRQENTLIKASAARNYLGENIFNDRYSYLEGIDFGEDDYIRVGKVIGGKESTRARNRLFRVAGLQQSMRYDMEDGDFTMNLEVAIKAHLESFTNVELKNDSSRFARSGAVMKDLYYELGAYSGYVKDRFSYKRISLMPSIRYELVEMYGYDRLAISQMPDNNGDKYFGSEKNVYSSLVPGATLSYDLIDKNPNLLNVFGGMYKGYTAPIADNAFLNVDDDVVSSPSPDKPINRKPEISVNYEFGIRGELMDQFANIQLIYFNNHIRNYYSAGRNEAFQTLGAVNIEGIETSINLHVHNLTNLGMHKLTVNCSGTFMSGRITEGVLSDADLLKAKHTDATREELIAKINAERQGFDVYYKNVSGSDSLVSGALAITDFSKINRLDFIFGQDGISDNTVPYLPPVILNAGFTYSFEGLCVGANINYVAKQYTDYLNFENETSEGAIGRLDAFTTIDANLSYTFKNSSNKFLNGLDIFIAGKNITNAVFRASRLHRVSSGIMPGGFRQVNAGIKLTIK